MKKLSLKHLNLGVEVLLQREQLKAIIGGYDSTCLNDADPVPYSWNCGDGNSGSGYTCPEHLDATIQFYLNFCNS